MNGDARAGRIPHVNALDGARGLAVAGVLFFHGGHLTGGYLGVDFFFTLSGFLITSLLLAESSRTGGIGLGGFWSRRARRLLPALAVLMVGIAIYCFALATSSQLNQIRGDAFATLAYVANWREIFSHQNYFAQFNAPSPLNHTWSLAIEEQFYVIWPLLFVGVLARWKRSTPKAILVISLVLAAASTALMIALYDPSNVSRVYYGTDTRASSILLGAALAAWLAMKGPTQNHNRRIALEALGIVSAIGLAIAWSRLDGQSSTLYRGGFLLCAIAATAIIATATHPDGMVVSRILSFGPLCALGLISYGVYLYHWPIDVAFDQKEVGFGGWPLFVFQSALAIGAAVVSYRLVEQPIRHGARSTAQLRKLTPAIAVGLVLMIFATTLGGTNEPTAAAFKHPLQAATEAARLAPPGAERVMIVGDSVGYFLGQAFTELQPKPPISVFNAGEQGCTWPPPATRVRYRNGYGTTLDKKAFGCDPVWETRAVARYKPNLIFWIVSNPPNAVKYRGNWLPACSTGYAALYVDSMRAEVEELRRHGANVVMTNEVYPRYLFAAADKATDCDNRLRQQVATAMHVQLIDLQHYVCPDKCREKINGVVLRVDGEHFEGAGGRLVANWLLSQVH